MNNASKIDTNWTKIFNKYPILQTIKDEGKYIITAQQIKEFWEPRLMTKHDHSVNRPQIFIDNSFVYFANYTRKLYYWCNGLVS